MRTYQYPFIPVTLKERNLHVSFGSHLLHLLRKLHYLFFFLSCIFNNCFCLILSSWLLNMLSVCYRKTKENKTKQTSLATSWPSSLHKQTFSECLILNVFSSSPSLFISLQSGLCLHHFMLIALFKVTNKPHLTNPKRNVSHLIS